MNSTELTLASKIAAFASKNSIELPAISVNIIDGVISLVRFTEEFETWQQDYIIATFDTQEEAISWALDGRKNWRKLNAAIKAYAQAEAILDELHTVEGATDTYFDREEDDLNSFDQIIEAQAFIKKNAPTAQQLADLEERKRIWELDYQRRNYRAKTSSDLAFQGYGTIEQRGIMRTVTLFPQGLELLEQLMAEWEEEHSI